MEYEENQYDFAPEPDNEFDEDWKNVKIPAIGKGKRTCFDDVIEISKKKLSP